MTTLPVKQSYAEKLGIYGQDNTVESIAKIFKVFQQSEQQLRPHFFLTGSTGSGKSMIIKILAQRFGFQFIKVNCAGLTSEGTSGNSVSKALAPLRVNNKPAIIFCDEFDKLIVTNGTNSDLAHEHTSNVQNELLTAMEDTAQVFGDYGKFVSVSTEKCLFVFAGSFNGEENIDSTRLKAFGVRDEFLGRCSLVYNLNKLVESDLVRILVKSPELNNYVKVMKIRNDEKEGVVKELTKHLRLHVKKSFIGARLIPMLVHTFFIDGIEGLERIKPSEDGVEDFSTNDDTF